MIMHFASVACLVLASAACHYFVRKRLLRYLQYLQQEDYESGRFIQWWTDRKAYDSRGLQLGAAAAVLTQLGQILPSMMTMAVTLIFAGLFMQAANKEEDPRVTGKVRLNLTERAKRILLRAGYIALFLQYLAALAVAMTGPTSPVIVSCFWISQIAIIQICPLILAAASSMLEPGERRLQEGFANEARKRLKEVDPMVIGITGSYGKTSSKVLLADMLNTVAPTFTTPRSINSYMGVTREIRERLVPQHKYAVIEMGAYYKGSIKRMCSLTPPKAALVTAVGQMHLERFGSQENVYLAKSELPEALPPDGILVVNGDYEYCRQMAVKNKRETTLIYGLDESLGHLDAVMFDLQPSEKGTAFKIRWQGKTYEGFAKLLGRPLLSNLLGTFTMACALGVNPELALAVLRNTKTESNRLEPVRSAIESMAIPNGRPIRSGEILRLNDAFNSNPQGFAGALEVLKDMPGNRKVLVTPGMIELGEKQVEENKRAAIQAATICDQVVLVGDTNREALKSGLTESGFAPSKLKEVPTMRDAFYFLSHDYLETGDVVLIENDLPDLYESKPVF